ncbi:TPA: DUF3983 domain-containing protein [Bacillus cereus]|nr:DUF3983 domain-containing protein [Bacillus cereus]
MKTLKKIKIRKVIARLVTVLEKYQFDKA